MFTHRFKIVSARFPIALNTFSLVFSIFLSWCFRTGEDQINDLSIILNVVYYQELYTKAYIHSITYSLCLETLYQFQFTFLERTCLLDNQLLVERI